MKVIIAIFTAMLISGCSLRPAIEEKIVSLELDKKVTKVCYDLIDKKDCPKGMLQYDINILPIIPLDSRFCFGIVGENYGEDGRYCYSRDIIKNK